jgi:hypothetical protein
MCEGLAVMLPSVGAEPPESVELAEFDVRAHEVRLARQDHLPDRDGLGVKLVALVVRGEPAMVLVRGPPPAKPGQQAPEKSDALPVVGGALQRLLEERERVRGLAGALRGDRLGPETCGTPSDMVRHGTAPR